MTTQLVILDRDGVINLDSDQYIKSAEEWIPIESSLRAIAKLNAHGVKVAIATNQSGLARGLFNSTTLAMIHKKMEMELASVGGHIDALEYCADHPDKAGPFRKPNPGMLLKLIDLFSVTAKDTWFVGDSISDILCARNANCKAALVLTGKGTKTLANSALSKSIPVFRDLATFVDEILTS
jgi:D-glycero-D-manno-heptose 1,7-bisphosphate phosphatase